MSTSILLPPQSDLQSEVMFFGSCGHTTLEVVDASLWERLAEMTQVGHPVSPSSELANAVKVGKRTRRVYIRPFRYMVCKGCFLEAWGEG